MICPFGNRCYSACRCPESAQHKESLQLRSVARQGVSVQARLAMKSPQDTHQTLRLRTCEGKPDRNTTLHYAHTTFDCKLGGRLSSDSRGSFQYPDKSSTHLDNKLKLTWQAGQSTCSALLRSSIAVQHVRAKDESTNSITFAALHIWQHSASGAGRKGYWNHVMWHCFLCGGYA